MANPPTAKAFDQLLDPSDYLDFYVIISQGAADASPPTVLLLGEAVASYRLSLSSEATALGLRIVDEEGFRPALEENILQLWLDVDEAMWSASLFDKEGVEVAGKVLITTTKHRRKERSFLVRMVNQ